MIDDHALHAVALGLFPPLSFDLLNTLSPGEDSPTASVSDRLSALFQTVPHGGRRFWEFFTVNIRNPNTRRAYFRAAEGFAAWCEQKGLRDLSGVTPMHIAAYVEQLGRTHSKPTVKQHLAAIRILFDWLVTGHTMESSPAHAVRGPKHIVAAWRGLEPVTRCLCRPFLLRC